MIGLPCGEKNYDEAVFIWYRNVTDRRTDGQTDRFAISISRVSMLTRDKNGFIVCVSKVQNITHEVSYNGRTSYVSN